MARFPFLGRPAAAGEGEAPAASAEPASPTRMRHREVIAAYGTAAVIAAGGVLNLVVTTGKGAPAHPMLWPSYVAILLAAGLVALTLRYRSRLVSPFVAIFGGMFDTLARTPYSLSTAHLVVIFVAFGFAVALTLRQRREQKALGITPGRGRPAARSGGARKGGDADADGPKKPPANRRYTPPKYAAKASSSRGRTPRR